MADEEITNSREDNQFLIGAGVTLVTTLIWGSQLFGLSQNQFDVLNPAGEEHPALWPPSKICAAFMMIHNIRLWLGLTFLDSDESFNKAVKEAEKDPNNNVAAVKRTHRVTLLIIYFVTATGAILAPRMEASWSFMVLAFMLIIQTGGLLVLDFNWWPILISKDSKDRERAANKFFIIGDFVVFAFTVILVFTAGFIATNGPSNSHVSSAVFLGIGGALFAIFVGECWSQYWDSFNIRLKSVRPK